MEEQKIGYAQEERIEIWGSINDDEDLNLKLVEVDREGKQIVESNLFTVPIKSIPKDSFRNDDNALVETVRLSKPLE